MYSVSNPFAELSDDERSKVASVIAESSEAKLKASFGNLRQGITNYEPLALLSHLSFFHLFSDDGTEQVGWDGRFIRQPHVELLQALILQHQRDAFPWMPTFPDIDGFLDDLEGAHQGFMHYRLARKENSTAQALFRTQELMRGATQVVRNWGYPDQIQEIVHDLFHPLDDRIETELGIKPTRLFGMFMKMVSAVEERYRRRLGQLLPLLSAKTRKQCIDAYDRLSSERGNDTSALERVLEIQFPDADLNQIKSLLLQHQNLLLSDDFSFSIEELMEMYGEEIERCSFVATLERLSFDFGSLAKHNAEQFLLDNPVWRRPMMKVDDDMVFIPIVALLLSFGLEILEEMVLSKETLATVYTEQRATYLEDAVATHFRRAFPGAQIYQGSMWPTKGEYENDLLVIVDRIAIVVESKAGSVSDSSRRGADKSLRSDITALAIEASRQSSAFQTYLRSNRKVHQFTTRGGRLHTVNVKQVKEFLRLNVTLHQLGPIYSHWTDLVEAGLIDADEDMASTLTLADLDSIFDLLDGQCNKLHYLARRAEIESHTPYIGGELDLLAFYVDTSFNIDELEFDTTDLLLDGKHRKLEPYFMRGETGRQIKKPRTQLSKMWRKMIDQLETGQPFGWARLGLALLSVPYEDQLQFEQRFATTKMVVRKHWRNKGHQDLIMMNTGPSARRLAVAGLAYRNEPYEAHRLRQQDAIHKVFSQVKSNRLFFIGVNVEAPEDLGGHDFFLVDRPDDESEQKPPLH